MSEYSVRMSRGLRRRMAWVVVVLYARWKPGQFFGTLGVELAALGVGLWQVLSIRPFVSNASAIGLIAVACLSFIGSLPLGMVKSYRRFAQEMPAGAIETLRFDLEGYATEWSDTGRRTYTFFGEIDRLFLVADVVVLIKRGSSGYLLYPREVFPHAEQTIACRQAATAGWV